VEPTSSGDLPALDTARREATRRASAPEAPGESTVLDLAEAPDNEPTSVWPLLASPIAEAQAAPLARGSSGRVTRRRSVGKYVLREKLARGAFGVVFSAHDPSLDRDVAIKVLRPTHHENDVIVQRFLHEARATARIAHPGVVTIHDCGQIETNLGETAFIAMELLSGQSLGDRLADVGRLAIADAIEIVRQVASALEAAHRVDVLHRDLKPDNIFLAEDPAMPSGERVKIFDFGLAKLGDRGHTLAESVFGTPHYMSPEQTRSTTQVDHRSDIYALGCILYELLAGRPPFDGSVRAVVDAHQQLAPPRASASVADLPPALDDLIAAMLAKDPMARPQTMGSVQRELQRITGRAPSQPAVRPAHADGSRPDAAPYPPHADASRPNAAPYPPHADPSRPNAAPYPPHAEASRPNAAPYPPHADASRPDAAPYPPHADASRPNAAPYPAEASRPSAPAYAPYPAEASRPSAPRAHALGTQPPAFGPHPLAAAAPGTLLAPFQIQSRMHPEPPGSRPPTPDPLCPAAAAQRPPGLAGPPSGVLLVPPDHAHPPDDAALPCPAAPRQTVRLLVYGVITAVLTTLAIVLALVTAA
jgi:serine/threonine protein kinase